MPIPLGPKGKTTEKVRPLAAQGLGAREIGEKLGLTAGTVSYHLAKIRGHVPPSKRPRRRIISVLGSSVGRVNGAVSSLNMSYYIAGLIKGSKINVQDVVDAFNQLKGDE